MGFHRKASGGGGITPEMFGCSKMAIDEVTISSRTLLGTLTYGFDFIHSLGETPKFYFIVKEDLSNIANSDFVFVMGFYTGAFGISKIVIGPHGGYYNDNSIYGGANNSSAISLDSIDATKIKICRYGSSSNYYRYLNTGKYKIITMA